MCFPFLVVHLSKPKPSAAPAGSIMPFSPSMQLVLDEPENLVLAGGVKLESALTEFGTTKEIALEENLIIVQIVKCDISLLAFGDCADPITIILSLVEKVIDVTELPLAFTRQNAYNYIKM